MYMFIYGIYTRSFSNLNCETPRHTSVVLIDVLKIFILSLASVSHVYVEILSGVSTIGPVSC